MDRATLAIIINPALIRIMNRTFTILCLLVAGIANAQTQQLEFWWFNTNGHTYNGVLTGVESVYYDNTYVYVSSSGIPSYYQAGQSVFDGADQDWTFRLPRTQQEATNKTQIGGGPIGLLVDGSAFFNPFDARSYQNQGIWNQVAYYYEGSDFDNTGGHSTPGNIYHHHVDNPQLHDYDSTSHSPIIGFAWDGYPVYGPFGYSDPNDPNSDITRIKPGWQLRDITTRTTLPDGTVSPGPAISSTNPLGGYGEDWEFVESSGHLDEYNGRSCITPEYPDGTYAYFCTVNADLTPRYPYFVGPYEYYGVIAPGNTGPQGGSVSIPGNATQYTPVVTGFDSNSELRLTAYPNPMADFMVIEKGGEQTYTIEVFDVQGRLVMRNILSEKQQKIDVRHLNSGLYIITILDETKGIKYINRLVKQ